MDRKLIKKYDESEKLQKQIEALQEKLQGVNDEAEELEKAELHKIFKSAKISFEEYTGIVKGFLSKDEVQKSSVENKRIYSNDDFEEEDFNNEQ